MKKLFVLLIMTVSASNICFASAIDAGSLNSQYVRDMRIQEAKLHSKNNSAIISTKTTPKTQEEVTNSDIKSIVFVNNESISSNELLNLVENKINSPMTAENISAIRKDIMKYYQQRGFFSAIAMVVSQDTQTGELVLEIKEGGRNSIIIQE